MIRIAWVLAALIAATGLISCSSDSSVDQVEVASQEREEAAAELEERVSDLQAEPDDSDPAKADLTPVPAQPPPAETAPVTPPPEPTPEASSSNGSDMGDWIGGNGYTAILASLGSEAEARSGQAEATSRGLDAGVLYSSNFRSLRPGYWVVFSGAFSDHEGAAERSSRAQSLGYDDAYPRFVSP